MSRGSVRSNASCGSWSRRRLRPFALLAALGVALAASPASASAEQPTITAQARAANAEFLAFAPPPPDGAGAVCLVDTGVDLNPDTESNVIERLALDGGDPGDVHHSKHGTGMAMVMGGPVNDWGSVGIWPHVRIVSVRAMPPGESSFPFNSYKRAVFQCRKYASRVKTVNLSLGGAGAGSQEIAELKNLINATKSDGLNVVAAAGNDGAAVQYPAAIEETFAVAAGQETGAFCSFSSRGDGLDIVAPGCDLDVSLAFGEPAYGNGTSASSAITAAVLTALRSYQPEIGPQEAEDLLLSTARQTSSGLALDVETAFRTAGLGDVVDAGEAAAPIGPPPSTGGANDGAVRPSVGAGTESLPRPKLLRSRYKARRLTLALANRPASAVVVARIVYSVRGDEFRRRERTIERATGTLRLRVPATWSRIELQYRSLELEPSDLLAVTPRSVTRGARSNKRPAS